MSKLKEINIPYFYLSPREEATMNVLWNTDEELSASDIANKIPNRSWPASSIQSILRSLEKKKAIKVSSIAKLGKSYGRLFRPNLTSNEYATMQFKRYYQKNEKDNFSLMSSLLEDISQDRNEILSILNRFLDENTKGH